MDATTSSGTAGVQHHLAEVAAHVVAHGTEAPMEAAAPVLTPARRSLLPAWLLASQQNLAKLTETHKEARQSIAKLRTSLTEFDDMVEETLQSPKAAEVEVLEEDVPKAEAGPHTLPEDVGDCVATFCVGLDLLVYGLTCRNAHVWLEAEAPWRSAFERQRLGACWWLGPHEFGVYRDAVMQHSVWTLEARSFVAEFAKQSSMKRRSGVEPRRYTRHDRDVSHPLPGSGTQSGDVVARMHTLGIEGRRRALVALEAFVLVTATSESDVAPDLVRRGAVTILVAFLANELGSIQDLAAAALANLICCDASQDEALNVMAACQARKPLVALLSSPAARVTLHQSSAPFSHLNRGAGQNPRARSLAKAAAFREREAYCQGMGCKAAARALCNACVPDRALALPPDGVFGGDDAVPREASYVDEWDFYSYHSSGSFNHKSRVLMHVEDGVVNGLGADNLGHFQLYGTARVDNGARVLYFSKSYSAQPVRDVTQSGHICHVAWGGTDPEDGFFGVWEVTSNDTHFELRRGGVCRIVPADDDTYGGAPPDLPASGARVLFPVIPGARP